MDALVNNAGAGVFREPEALTPVDFEATLAICLKAPFLLIRAFAPSLEASGGAGVNISSIGAVTGFRGAAAYCAAKAGLEGMSRALAEEAARPRHPPEHPAPRGHRHRDVGGNSTPGR